MAPSRSSLLGLLASAPAVLAQACTLQFDGRIPAGFAVADFDAGNDIFDPANVVGQGRPLSNGPPVVKSLGAPRGLTINLQGSPSVNSLSFPP